MVPPAFANFFIASANAGGALVGLLFVAISIAPEQIVAAQAPMERQAVAGSAFTALMNAFFISLSALIPHFNIGFFILPFSFVCLSTSLIQVWSLLRRTRNWQSLLRKAFLILISVALYGLELWNGYQLFTDPSQPGNVYGLISCLLGAFGIGLIRAWELLGVRRYGLLGWLNPLRDLDDTQSFSRIGNSHTATEHSPIDEATTPFTNSVGASLCHPESPYLVILSRSEGSHSPSRDLLARQAKACCLVGAMAVGCWEVSLYGRPRGREGHIEMVAPSPHLNGTTYRTEAVRENIELEDALHLLKGKDWTSLKSRCSK